MIADGHPLFRSGLRQAIETEREFSAVGRAAGGGTALELMTDLRLDVAILYPSLVESAWEARIDR